MGTKELADAALAMMGDLDRERLIVALYWANDNEDLVVRKAESRNPEWYRNLCARYPKDRGRWLRARARAAGRQVSDAYGARRRKARYTDSLIVRSMVYDALQRIADGSPGDGIYIERVMPFVLARAMEMREMVGDRMEPVAAPVGESAEIYL